MQTGKNKYLTWAIILMPILSLYGFRSIGMDFGTINLIIAFMCACGKKQKVVLDISKYKFWIIYIVYVVASIIFPYVNLHMQNTGIPQTLKNIVLIGILLICVSNHMVNSNYLIKMYLQVAKIATVFIIIQTLVYHIFHLIVPGYGNILLMSPSYAEGITQVVGGLYRPTSLFYEPAHYFEYMLPALVILLFGNYSLMPKNIFFSMFISLGVILSGSGMGILTIVGCWGLWCIKNIKEWKIEKNVLITCGLFLMLGVIFLQTSYAKMVFGRVFGNANVSYTAVNGRMDIYKNIFQQNIYGVLFGNGYGNTIGTLYYPNWAFNIWCLGIIGGLIILMIYSNEFRKCKEEYQKVLLGLNLFLCLGTTLFMGKYIIFYFIFIMNEVEESAKYERIGCYNC